MGVRRLPAAGVSRILARVQTMTDDVTRNDRWAALQPWISLLVRLGLAAIWIIAGAKKITDLDANVRSVRAYRLLPETLAQFVGSAQPFVEIGLGLLLLIGLGTRVASIVSALGMVLFIAGIASAAARGLKIDCGCFSSGGDLKAGESTQYTWEIIRDSLFFLLSVFLAWRPLSRISADGALFPPLEEEAA